MKQQSVLLVILDGWGIRRDPRGNAILEAHPVYYSHLLQTYPHVSLEASGQAVGLPAGQIGNSEVGHLNMGSGRVVYQTLTQIDKAIEDGTFFQNETLLQGIRYANEHDSTLHLMGLVSTGGVHSSLNHLLALIQMAHDNGVKKLRVHAFLDGRDVSPQSAIPDLLKVEALLLELGYPQIATVSGRYYAMDRDKRWDRVEKAYNNLVSATGIKKFFSEDSVESAYQQGETDEFVSPTVCDITYEGMHENDSIIFFNFRPDRARELTHAFIDPSFSDFERSKVLKTFSFVCMSMYDETFKLPIAFPKQPLTHILAEVLSENGIHQFHTAETEKYAHVTYFFNGGFEAPYPGENRKMIPSPKVATYDLQPEMSLSGVSDGVIQALQSGNYQFIVTNFANPDMVGHTGKLDAAIEAVNAVDKALNQVIETALSLEWTVLLTADHGNIEMMLDENGNPHTAHTTDLVPLFLISKNSPDTLDQSKTYPLSTIAPTVLSLMGLPIPAEMTTSSVLVHHSSELTHHLST
jgi:2,3-bisphosphoglycerate-independent phosphoglycerate mutase